MSARVASTRQCIRDYAHLQHQATGDRGWLKPKVLVEGVGCFVDCIDDHESRGDLLTGSEGPAKSVAEERSTQT